MTCRRTGQRIDCDWRCEEVCVSPPIRIQRKRTKGWRMPEGAVYVGRPTEWGNHAARRGEPDPDPYSGGAPMSAQMAVDYFAWAVSISPNAAQWVAPLRGKDLACWCPLDQPCHADVLLELANRD